MNIMPTIQLAQTVRTASAALVGLAGLSAFAASSLGASTSREPVIRPLKVGEIDDVIAGVEQQGLTDPMGGEVHAVLRLKGPIIPARLEEQLSSFEGGCDVSECVNVQGAAHLPHPPDPQAMQLEDLQAADEALRSSLDRLMVRNGLAPD